MSNLISCPRCSAIQPSGVICCPNCGNVHQIININTSNKLPSMSNFKKGDKVIIDHPLIDWNVGHIDILSEDKLWANVVLTNMSEERVVRIGMLSHYTPELEQQLKAKYELKKPPTK